MNDPRQIENLLRDAAERVRVERGMPAKVRRRIRMRRIGTAAISLSVVAGLIVGGLLATEPWSPDPIPASEEQRDEREIVVTREDPSLPEGCGVRQATEAILSFTEALSAGDLRALDGSFSMGKIFRSVGIADPHGLTGEATVDRAALMAYLEVRIAHEESYRLTKTMVETEITSPNPQGTGAVRVSFLATRRADDIAESPVIRGWAELDCPTGDIYLMNVGSLHPAEAIERWCPAATPGSGDVVIACSRELRGKKAIIFPVLTYTNGEEAGLGGRLVRRGRCLYVQSRKSSELAFPMWPPGFSYEMAGGVLTVHDANGAPVAQTGAWVSMAGGYHGGEGGPPPPEFRDEWKPCGPVDIYFAVSYVADEDDPDR